MALPSDLLKPPPERLDELAARFRRFAELEARGYSPLHDRLCLAIAARQSWRSARRMARASSGSFRPVAQFRTDLFPADLLALMHPLARGQPRRRDMIEKAWARAAAAREFDTRAHAWIR